MEVKKHYRHNINYRHHKEKYLEYFLTEICAGLMFFVLLNLRFQLGSLPPLLVVKCIPLETLQPMYCTANK